MKTFPENSTASPFYLRSNTPWEKTAISASQYPSKVITKAKSREQGAQDWDEHASRGGEQDEQQCIVHVNKVNSPG